MYKVATAAILIQTRGVQSVFSLVGNHHYIYLMILLNCVNSSDFSVFNHIDQFSCEVWYNEVIMIIFSEYLSGFQFISGF